MRLVFCLTAVLVVIAGTKAVIECERNEDCEPSTATCVFNFCECPKGEVLNGDGTKCLKPTTVIEGSCEIGAQCALFGGPVTCRDRKCQCPDDHIYLKKQCVKKQLNLAACVNNDQCFDGLDYNSRVCQDGTCQCAAGYYDRNGVDCRRKAALDETCSLTLDCQDKDAVCLNKVCKQNGGSEHRSHLVSNADENDLDVLKEGMVLNEPCTLGDACADANALCSPIAHTCQCRNGFFKSGQVCVRELGMECADNSECSVANSLCEQNICSCKSGLHFQSTNQKCRDAAYQMDDQLRCNNANSCRMLINHYDCDKITKFCRCDKGFKLNEEYICEASCERDTDCSIEHQICDATLNSCVCGPEYLSVDGVCKPRVGGACKTTAECLEEVDNSNCKNKVCVCNQNFVAHEYTCLEESPINVECTADIQCAWKWNSTCTPVANDKKACKCDKGYRNVNGNCLRLATRIGDYCTHPSVCLTDTICEKSKCTCTKGLTPSKDKARCLDKNADESAGDRLSAPTIINLFITLTIFILPAFNN